MQAHEALAAHYEQKEIEWIYHVNQLDWSQGVDLWVGVFDEALKVSRYELCRALLDLRQELTIRTPFKLGSVSSFEGQYYQNLALYDAAKQEYGEAIAAYDENLATDSDSIASLNNKGNSLQSLADLQTILSEHSAARASYGASIAACDAALEQAPNDVEVLNNRGNSLQRLADLQAILSEHSAARASYEASIAAYDVVLERAPDYVSALNNKGTSLQKLADLQAMLSEYSAARASYEASIAVYDAVLERAPDYVNVLNNKGTSLQKLADLLIQQEKVKLAIDCLGMALSLCGQSLQIAPNNWQHHLSIGNIRLRLASLLHSTQLAQSDAYGQQALEDWNRAVELNPDSAELQERRDWLLTELQNNGLA